MTSKHSTVWHDWSQTGTCDMLSTGKTSRLCTEVILYDERGALITNYTNGNTYEFDTLRPISTRAIEAPDWGNQNGFIIEERGTFRARCEKQKVYLLFVHIDNVAPYARELFGYWHLVGDHDPGAIGCEFSLNGCTFARFLSNPHIKAARQGVTEIVEQYGDDPRRSPVSSGYSAYHNSGEAIAYCRNVIEVLKCYESIVEEITTTRGIVELIDENGATERIGRNDWYDITHEFDLY